MACGPSTLSEEQGVVWAPSCGGMEAISHQYHINIMDANSYQVDTSPVSYQVSITQYHKDIIKSDLYRNSYQKWGNTDPKNGGNRASIQLSYGKLTQRKQRKQNSASCSIASMGSKKKQGFLVAVFALALLSESLSND